jgi:hypothetical protein
MKKDVPTVSAIKCCEKTLFHFSAIIPLATLIYAPCNPNNAMPDMNYEEEEDK